MSALVRGPLLNPDFARALTATAKSRITDVGNGDVVNVGSHCSAATFYQKFEQKFGRL